MVMLNNRVVYLQGLQGYHQLKGGTANSLLRPTIQSGGLAADDRVDAPHSFPN